MVLYPPDDPYLINRTVSLIVLVLVAGLVFGAIAGSWLAETRYTSPNARPRTPWGAILAGSLAGVIIALIGASLVSPDDPLLIYTAVPLTIRWYGVLIVAGAVLGSWLIAWRASRRGYNPDHVWNQLIFILIFGIVGARAYYVVFEWERFGGNIPAMINITTGGLAIHGAIIGFILAILLYTWLHRIPFLSWADIVVPGVLLAQAIGRWGNFFNQEAYGTPTSLAFGVQIDAEHRLPAYPISEYPPDTLFHATFLYESLWNLAGVVVLLVGERLFRRNLRPGDVLFLYLIIYSSGRVWIEGLRTDSLTAGPLRVAQIVSIVLIVVGIVALFLNHRLRATPARKRDTREKQEQEQEREAADEEKQG
jgi:phosphatidylglycerol:prolipoprotein diacylglycerol transferase